MCSCVDRVKRLVPLLVVLLSAGPLRAQTRATTADLSGLVMDSLRGSLPAAIVTATNSATNLERSATTETDGRFAIPALPPGTYTVKAELPGFVAQVKEQVVLTLGEAIRIDFTLAPAGIQERVTVTADLPLVDPQKTVIGTVISQTQIDNLPINGRNFISFSVITPGAAADRTPQQGASATSGLTFAGQRARSNNITVDGLDDNDSSVGGVRATFSQEAVREFQVLTNSYSAEFGKASGGVVNIVTKSGTNTLAGNAFFFFRDDSLNARGYFEKFDPFGQPIDQPKAPYGQQQLGATLGGPIRKDRTFFFLSFERLNVKPATS
jgi:carboxypeptidase family protein